MPDDLQHLPPSAKYVYHVLRHADEPVPRSELLTMTGLPEPTVDRAIEQIRAEGLLNRTRHPHDLRHVFYQIDRQ
jgi:DNA-binding MarR family transcriptional regulator